ncbi:hypothetical protein TeGR_g10989, partial [Tetraparma gracilis]
MPPPSSDRSDRGGDCMDVLVVLSSPSHATVPSSAPPSIQSCSDWTVSFRRSGRVVRGARRVIKRVSDVGAAVARRLSLSSSPGLSRGESARASGVLSETFDEDGEDDDSEEDEAGTNQGPAPPAKAPPAKAPGGAGSPRQQGARASRRGSMSAAIGTLKEKMKAMAASAGGPSGRRASGLSKSGLPRASARPAAKGAQLPSIPSSPAAARPPPADDGDDPDPDPDPSPPPGFIGQDNFTVHVYLNDKYVPELEMRLPDGSATGYGQF